MSFYAYRLTGDPKADTKALKAWGLDVTVTKRYEDLAVEIDNAERWLTGCCGYWTIADAGSLVVFSPDERSPLHIKIAPEVTAADAPEEWEE